MRISKLNWMQLEAYLERDDRCVLPLGSTEQHAYLSLASEIGLIGSMLYFAFFAIVVARTWRGSSATTDPELRFFADALLIAFAGLFVNSLYDPMHEDAVMTMLWMYCGLAFVLAKMAGRGSDERNATLAAVRVDSTRPSRDRVGSRRAR